jgi:hypothetical protein
MSVLSRRTARLLMTLSVAVVASGSSAAHAATPQAVAPFAIDGMSCPSLTECVAVGHTDDAPGLESSNNQWATFNPQALAPVTPVTATGYLLLQHVACTSPTLCVASGPTTVSVFDPTSTAQPSTTTLVTQMITNIEAFTGVACPSASQCTAITSSGVAYTFDPASVASARQAQAVADEDGDPFGKRVAGIACPTVTQCTAYDITGRVATFNPQAPSAATPVKVSDLRPESIACASATHCAVLAERDSPTFLVRFNPAAPAPGNQVKFDVTSGVLACPSPTLCAAATAKLFGFDPTSTAAPHMAAPRPDGTFAPPALACSSATQCTAGGYDGRAVTFDPSQNVGGLTPNRPGRPTPSRPTPNSITVKAGTPVSLIVAVKGAQPGKRVSGTLFKEGRVLKTASFRIAKDGTTTWPSLRLKPGSYVAAFKLGKKPIKTIRIHVTKT